MGVYINPLVGTKEEYLWDNGVEITEDEAKSFNFGSEEAEHTSVVVLVRNPLFSAAGVMFDAREQEDFLNPEDHRPRIFFKISKEKLTCPESGIDKRKFGRIIGVAN